MKCAASKIHFAVHDQCVHAASFARVVAFVPINHTHVIVHVLNLLQNALGTSLDVCLANCRSLSCLRLIRGVADDSTRSSIALVATKARGHQSPEGCSRSWQPTPRRPKLPHPALLTPIFFLSSSSPLTSADSSWKTKDLVAQGELVRKAQQSARAALEQQKQQDAVVEKEGQKKENLEARKKKRADYMKEKRQDSTSSKTSATRRAPVVRIRRSRLLSATRRASSSSGG